MAHQAVQQHGVSIKAACQAFQISQACYRYVARRSMEDDEIARWLLSLTDNNRNWGFGLWPLLPVPAQCAKLRMEPQARLPCLPGAGVEPVYQASQAIGARKT